eukprot:SAG11_NODE_10774_length_806_cov_1.140028_1_plen_72_part_00
MLILLPGYPGTTRTSRNSYEYLEVLNSTKFSILVPNSCTTKFSTTSRYGVPGNFDLKFRTDLNFVFEYLRL